jgi:hypothetical protein
MLRHYFPGSSIWRLETLVSKLLELTDKVVEDLGNRKSISSENSNTKRKSKVPLEEALETKNPKKIQSLNEKAVLRELVVTKTENIFIGSQKIPNENVNLEKETFRKSEEYRDMKLEIGNCENNIPPHGSVISRGPAAYGTLTTDTPVKICAHTLLEDKKPDDCSIKRLFFKVEWNKREDGTSPEPSFYSYNILKKKAPGIILDYIENVVQLD